ncbi:MAG: ABC transporter ATP-binding protein [Chloroflexi bacterium]|jgi:peptide/nickel transport system ATP-binding protein|nr:ABC transporter ATP-binding protein [Anaerolineaceae bacterium]NMB88758.1 ABC transporter ATP-binding protein [Chloroflexota bacterium]
MIDHSKAIKQGNLVEVRNLKKYFPVQKGYLEQILAGRVDYVRAVDGVSFDIRQGEAFGLAGESGSGKSTIGRLVIGLDTPTEGQVTFDGIDLSTQSSEEMRRLRRRMQVIFQDPMASLNPRMTLGEAVSQGLKIHFAELANQHREMVMRVFDRVGLTPAQYFYNKYPHQISGGQRQRVVIARALITQPDLVLADEPIAMADVSVRALLLDLMVQLKKELNLTYLFITHDLATAKYICDRIGILYLGRMAEVGDLPEVYSTPLHPYTRALMAAVPVPDPHERRTTLMPEGEIPNPINPPSGCRFHPRCPYAQAICSQEEPVLRELRPEHQVACHFAEQFLE